MTVGIVGLGLIGGSLAKAITRNTAHDVLGTDINESVTLKAGAQGAVSGVLTPERVGECDAVILALYPGATVAWVRENAARLKKGCIVIDCCGVKRVVTDALKELAEKSDFVFIGGHPMAGKQFSGFQYSSASLFDHASMIFTPYPDIDIASLYVIRDLFRSIGFSNIEITTPENHDSLIAYTSQLAHVVSNAYVKSPNALRHSGFSAGSYKDLTRVAWLNEDMWTELFFDNADNLAEEIDSIVTQLSKYSAALKAGDHKLMRELLLEGKLRKEKIDGKEDLE